MSRLMLILIAAACAVLAFVVVQASVATLATWVSMGLAIFGAIFFAMAVCTRKDEEEGDIWS